MEENRRHSPGHIQPCLRLRRPPGHAAVEIFRSDTSFVESLDLRMGSVDPYRSRRGSRFMPRPAWSRGGRDPIGCDNRTSLAVTGAANDNRDPLAEFPEFTGIGLFWVAERLLRRLLPNVHLRHRRRSLDNEGQGVSRRLTVIARNRCLCRFDLSATYWFGHSSRHEVLANA